MPHSSGKQILLPCGKFLSSVGDKPSKALQHLLNGIKMGAEESAEAKMGSYLGTTGGQKITPGFTFYLILHRDFFYKKARRQLQRCCEVTCEGDSPHRVPTSTEGNGS